MRILLTLCSFAGASSPPKSVLADASNRGQVDPALRPQAALQVRSSVALCRSWVLNLIARPDRSRPIQILALQPHGAWKPLRAITRDRTPRASAKGAQRKRSHLLGEATLPIADRAKTPIRTKVPYRPKEPCAGDSRNPARPRMISAAKVQIPTASALAMRSRIAGLARVPPQAARPTGAPRARAA